MVGRLAGLLVGLVAIGAGNAAMANGGLGLGPWQVFHQGISVHTGLSLGTITILLGIPILALWWPLGERPGLGTVLNVALVGSVMNVTMPVLPTPGPDAPAAQLALMAGGVLLVGVGTGLYLAADLGAGPRDGLMVGIHHRFGWSIRRTRTAIELAVLAAGFVLGGTVGLGTVVFALGIGPIVQASLRLLDREGRIMRRRGPELAENLETPAAAGE
ncbi:MAG: ugpQ 1 [Chloroflexi bacterium]|nr:ugpQ 1 [Chloroflexota bacterium]